MKLQQFLSLGEFVFLVFFAILLACRCFGLIFWVATETAAFWGNLKCVRLSDAFATAHYRCSKW
jgi:hypothetical protein